jgi:acetyl esterase/lipase
MSWQAKTLDAVALPIKRRMKLDVEKQTRRALERQAKPVSLPKLKGVDVRRRTSHGMEVYELTPTAVTPTRTVFYVHGGSYLYPAAAVQWRFVARVAVEAGVRVVAPHYPLAPGTTAGETVDRVTSVLGDLPSTEPLVVLGDSAGGGLALAITQELRDWGAKLPERVVLIAPWLDISVSDPAQPAMQDGDVMLTVEGLQAAGKLYAGDLPVTDPRVSPLHGDLQDLPPISVFVGTSDLLVHDARALARRAAEIGAVVDVVEAEGMQHVYPMLPLLPEAKAARRQIVELIRRPAG